jgi:hypothetical protein
LSASLGVPLVALHDSDWSAVGQFHLPETHDLLTQF